MHINTLKALNGSIEKWEKIVSGKGIDLGQDNCSLCKLFWRMDGACGHCPVAEKTGQDGCLGTSYFDYSHLSRKASRMTEGSVRDNVLREAEFHAMEMVKFLKSLLPKKK